MSKRVLAFISPHSTSRTPPPRPAPDLTLEEMAVKKLEEEEELMEEDLKNQVPKWHVLDDAWKNGIRESYRLAEKGELEHPPGLLRHANQQRLQQGDEEREEILRDRYPGYLSMIPADREALMINERWNQRGGWGSDD